MVGASVVDGFGASVVDGFGASVVAGVDGFGLGVELLLPELLDPLFPELFELPELLPLLLGFGVVLCPLLA